MMTANTTRRAPPGFAIAVLVALCGAPSISEAASGVCNELVTMLDRTTAKEFQVNTDNIAAVTNGAYDSNGAIQAAMLASGAWNEQANAGLFEYAGIDTSRTDITNCATQPSIIVFVDGCCTVGPSFSCAAVSNSRCSGTKFKITVFKQGQVGGVCSNKFSDNGAVTGNRDLVGMLVHEFGHTLGLDHADASDDAVMVNPGVPSALWRNLYQLDMECAHDLAGERSLTGYSQLHDNTGFLGASPCTTSGSVTKVSSGITQDSGTYYWASGQHRRTVTAWDENVTNDTTYMTLSNPGVRNGVGFVAGLFRETASTDRVFYSYYVDSPTSYDFASTHHVRQIRSTADMASGSQSANWFQHCTATGGTTMSCASGSRLDLHSARSLSFGWLDFASGTDRTVVAWLNQDSTSLGQNSDSNRVRVSVGLVDDDTLAEPDDLPDFTSPTTIAGRSAVGPAVACKENYTSTYDCIVAWVPIDDIDNNIRVARFSVAPPGGGVNRYVATFESSYKSVGGTTADSLTAWWNSNTSKFYVAFRSSSTGQKVNVRRSSDGSAWSAEVTGLDDTYLPPSAAGTWTGSTNLLIYAK